VIVDHRSHEVEIMTNAVLPLQTAFTLHASAMDFATDE
jgi:hypothetical protein